MQPIVVSGVRVPFADYRRLYFSLTYRSMMYFAVPLVIVVGIIIALANVRYLATPWFYGPPLVLVLALVAAGLVYYLGQIRKSYEASGLAYDALDYTFDAKRLTVTGRQSDALDVRWDTITEAQRRRNWLMLTTTAPATHLIDLGRVQPPATEAALLQLLADKGVVLK
ncbi:hypothetical protein [Hymenobacter latericus]|uniref:hypothetical protein n=1 Tax=Hymenobacter sp. YIM 151858-1 TaxID=2987688 RepID=UPI0022276565|nr:hypothetical protein [Hymenobacter sp. YIM 151858-1]UYZ61016.1 hypothetical protein OIS50_09465 [Hymenobacter sp. YIM 151858-1]